MVDSIGAKPITDTATTRVAAAVPVAATTATAPGAGAGSAQANVVQTGDIARTMADSAPVETDRVATIKKAIAEGRFPILPATIADRLIALKLQWNPNGAQHDAG